MRARTPRFACGGDDYLFILFDGISPVRAIPPPAAATAAATAAIAAQLLSARVCCAAHSCPPPMGLTGRGLLLPARYLCAQLLAAGVACDKWQIQKWPFATVSASGCALYCSVLFLLCGIGHCIHIRTVEY